MHNQQSGFSIIEVMVFGALLAVGLALGNRVFSNNRYALDMANSKGASIELEDLLASRITLGLGPIMENLSGSGSSCNLSGGAITEAINSRLRTRDITIQTSTLPEVSFADPRFSSAQTRCSSGQIPANISHLSEFYFCVRISSSAAQDRSIFDPRTNLPIFAEIKYQLRDFAAGSSGELNCQTFRATATRGAVVFYRLYWVRKIDDKDIYNIKSGQFYAPTSAL